LLFVTACAAYLTRRARTLLRGYRAFGAPAGDSRDATYRVTATLPTLALPRVPRTQATHYAQQRDDALALFLTSPATGFCRPSRSSYLRLDYPHLPLYLPAYALLLTRTARIY